MRYPMRLLSLSLVACVSLLALGLAACTPARTGTVGNTLTTNIRPTVSLTANPPMQLFGAGTLWVRASNNNRSMNLPTVRFSYALFSTTKEGPVTDSAHAAIMHLPDNNQWRFSPNPWPRFLTLSFGEVGVSDDNLWPSRLLRIPSEGDWISDVWKANGREVPEVWLARRWADTLGEIGMAVMEYREPWPEGLNEFMLGDALFGDGTEMIAAFSRRAQNIFSMSNEYAGLPDEESLPAINLPARRPNTLRLIGDIDPVDRGLSKNFIRF